MTDIDFEKFEKIIGIPICAGLRDSINKIYTAYKKDPESFERNYCLNSVIASRQGFGSRYAYLCMCIRYYYYLSDMVCDFDEDDGWIERQIPSGHYCYRVIEANGWKRRQLFISGEWIDVAGECAELEELLNGRDNDAKDTENESVEVVISLPKKTYEVILHKTGRPKYAADIEKAVNDGIILPENHGRIGDLSKLEAKITELRDGWDRYGNEYESARFESYDYALDEILEADTIIPSINLGKNRLCLCPDCLNEFNSIVFKAFEAGYKKGRFSAAPGVTPIKQAFEQWNRG